MLIMTRDPDAPADSLLENFLALDSHTPEGYRAELIDGAITVVPPPDGEHEDIVWLIESQVARKSVTDMAYSANKGLIVPSDGQADSGRIIPDITIAPAATRLFRAAPSWMQPAGVTMVVEVTSSRPEDDRKSKRHAYAAAKIPLYLLVDRETRQAILFSDPERGDYQRTSTVSFGGNIELPEPFSFKLDTSKFAD